MSVGVHIELSCIILSYCPWEGSVHVTRFANVDGFVFSSSVKGVEISLSKWFAYYEKSVK